MLRRLWIALTVISLQAVAMAKPEYPLMGPDIFDAQATAESLVAKALTDAKQQHKRVLLLFGANWCPWCRQLHATLNTDELVRRRLKESFVLVFVDANTRNDKNRNAAVLERYGNPTLQYGLPVFVLLDGEGKHLATRETASLGAETDAKVAQRVLAFLEESAK